MGDGDPALGEARAGTTSASPGTWAASRFPVVVSPPAAL